MSNILASAIRDWDNFVEHIWEKRPEKFAVESSSLAGEILTPQGFETLLTRNDLPGSLIRIFENAQLIPRQEFCRNVEIAADAIEQFVDPSLVLARYHAGCTMVMSGVHLFDSQLKVVREQVANDLGLPTEIYLFVTSSGAPGLAPHFDYEHAFAFQAAGRKRWWTYDPIERSAIGERFLEVGEPTAVFDLDPGQLLYIPSGIPHHAQALDNISIHMDICVYPVYWQEVIRQVIERVLHEPPYRRMVPVGMMSEGSSFSPLIHNKLSELVSSFASRDAEIVEDVRRELLRIAWKDSIQENLEK